MRLGNKAMSIVDMKIRPSHSFRCLLKASVPGDVVSKMQSEAKEESKIYRSACNSKLIEVSKVCN